MDARPTPAARDAPTERPASQRRQLHPNVLRGVLAFEALTFLTAAVLHRQIGDVAAMTAETVIGAVLLAGLAFTWLRPKAWATTSFAVQSFALLGTLVGLGTILIGIGPRTVPDVVYHVGILVVLAVGCVAAWRARVRDRA